MNARRGPRIGRRSLFGVGVAAALAACTPDEELRITLSDGAVATTVLPAQDPAGAALAVSSAVFTAADVAVVAAETDVGALAALSVEAGLPLLVGTGQGVADELGRLGTRIVVTSPGTDLAALGDVAEILDIDPSAADAAGTLPPVMVEGEPTAVSLLLDPAAEDSGQAVARANIEAAGGVVADIPGGDPRASSETVAAAKDAVGEDPATGVLILGENFGAVDQVTAILSAAATVPELPGGGQIVFPHRRMIAVYGSPGVPSLGILGEQDLPATIERVRGLAAEYEEFSEVPVIPAFEIITTVASDAAGVDGDYSNELPADMIREWVNAAGEAGVYVVLDLQPGTADFLTQAKLYEDLLKQPHVGLALDPEWRLSPGQRHMVQIGSVTADEVNEVASWLAELTVENSLPQKVFILHQFSLAMISDRERIDASLPELAMLLHADGHGAPGDKMATWTTLQQGLPAGIGMAWKNFYDEDLPTFTPEETYAIEPRPWFVSYQ